MNSLLKILLIGSTLSYHVCSNRVNNQHCTFLKMALITSTVVSGPVEPLVNINIYIYDCSADTCQYSAHGNGLCHFNFFIGSGQSTKWFFQSEGGRWNI